MRLDFKSLSFPTQEFFFFVESETPNVTFSCPPSVLSFFSRFAQVQTDDTLTFEEASTAELKTIKLFVRFYVTTLLAFISPSSNQLTASIIHEVVWLYS
jgi:hypothetical protein